MPPLTPEEILDMEPEFSDVVVTNNILTLHYNQENFLLKDWSNGWTRGRSAHAIFRYAVIEDNVLIEASYLDLPVTAATYRVVLGTTRTFDIEDVGNGNFGGTSGKEVFAHAKLNMAERHAGNGNMATEEGFFESYADGVSALELDYAAIHFLETDKPNVGYVGVPANIILEMVAPYPVAESTVSEPDAYIAAHIPIDAIEEILSIIEERGELSEVQIDELNQSLPRSNTSGKASNKKMKVKAKELVITIPQQI